MERSQQSQAELDRQWMECALQLAREAEQCGEVPVGAVVVRGDQLLGTGRNGPIGQHDPTAHAEIQALRAAAAAEGNYRLPGTTLYVTLEPCPMCAGAIIQARVGRVVFAASDPRAGAAGSQFQLLQHTALNHRCELATGVLAAESSALLRAFFRRRRKTREQAREKTGESEE
jgi:tRNA(adenine34) deaminase